MSSRDGSDGSSRARRTPSSNSPQRRQPTRSSSTWDIDPAEIDRYLSGRPSRDQETQDRSRRSRTTVDQLGDLRRAVKPADDDVVLQQDQSMRVRASASTDDPDYAYDQDPYADLVENEDVLDAAPTNSEMDDDVVVDQTQVRSRRTPRRAATSTRSSRRPTPTPAYEDTDDEFYNDDPYLSYEDAEIERSSRPARRQRVDAARGDQSAGAPRFTMPASVSQAPILADRWSLGMFAVAFVSLLAMLFVVRDRLDGLPEAIFTHVSAGGDAENFETREALWRLPLLAGMVTLMNFILAWFLSRWGSFMPRLLLGGTLLVHFVTWIAVIKYLWP